MSSNSSKETDVMRVAQSGSIIQQPQNMLALLTRAARQQILHQVRHNNLDSHSRCHNGKPPVLDNRVETELDICQG